MAKLSHRIKYGWTKKQVEHQLVAINFLGNKVPVHKKIAHNFEAVSRRIRAYEKHYRLKPYKPAQIGTYNYRKMQGSNSLSEHALGVAIDLDWVNNPMTKKRYKTTIPSYVIHIFNLCGFDWGGHWRKRFDPMHFQIGDGIIRPFTLPKKKKELSELDKAIAWVKKNKIINDTKNRTIDMHDLIIVIYRFFKLLKK